MELARTPPGAFFAQLVMLTSAQRELRLFRDDDQLGRQVRRERRSSQAPRPSKRLSGFPVLRIDVAQAESSASNELLGVPWSEPSKVAAVEDAVVVAWPAPFPDNPLQLAPVQDVGKADDHRGALNQPRGRLTQRCPRIHEVLEDIGGNEAIEGCLGRRRSGDEVLGGADENAIQHGGRVTRVFRVDFHPHDRRPLASLQSVSESAAGAPEFDYRCRIPRNVTLNVWTRRFIPMLPPLPQFAGRAFNRDCVQSTCSAARATRSRQPRHASRSCAVKVSRLVGICRNAGRDGGSIVLTF